MRSKAPHPLANRLLTHLLVGALLLLVLLRQQVIYLDHLRVRCIQEEARINDQTLREANQQMKTFLGIGLYLSKIIIKQHGGRVGVQSRPGQGSTYWFTLPLASPGQGQECQAAGAPETEPGPLGQS